MSITFRSLWCEKYRPQTLSDMVLSEENKSYFSSIKDDIPHMMFVGPPGIGKCLDGDELIEIYVQDEDTYNKLVVFLEKENQTKII